METLKWMIRCVGGIRLFSKQHLPINLTGISHLDFTGVIEEHNEVHHRQRLMELPVREPTFDILILALNLGEVIRL